MASHQGIQQHLDNISEAGKSCLNDDPGSRSRLVSALTVAQREIEGPGAYLSRTRFAVNLPNGLVSYFLTDGYSRCITCVN